LCIVNHQFLDTFHRTTVRFCSTYHQVKGLSLFIYLRHDLTGHVNRDKLTELRQRNTVLGQHFTLRHNLQFRTLNLLPSKSGKGVAVKAPIGGFVKNCLVKEGDYVTIGQPLMTVTQMRRLVLKADVSERYYAQLPRIVSANFKTPYNNKVYSLENLGGKVLSFGKSSGDTSYYVPVTFEFDNRGDMVPGAFVEVFLLSGERQGVISLPESALTEEQGLYFVYLKLDDECYKKQEVQLGTSNGERVEILSGLKDGDTVVTRGAIHVKLAAASNAIPAHSHNH
jgi:hypothetical protein